jgi:beta-glucosidase
VSEAVAAGAPDPFADPELVRIIGTMPMSTLANFGPMSLDHDTVDRLAGLWAERTG